MPWIGPAIGLIGGQLLGGGGSSGSSSSGTPYYTPSGLSGADTGWQQAYANQQGVVNQTANQTQPAYQQSLQAMQGNNYAP